VSELQIGATGVHSVSSSDMGKVFFQSRKPLKVWQLPLDLLSFILKKDAFADNMKYHIIA